MTWKVWVVNRNKQPLGQKNTTPNLYASSSLDCKIWQFFLLCFKYIGLSSEESWVSNQKQSKGKGNQVIVRRHTLLFPGREKKTFFTMTPQVAGSTHSVLLPMNVILVKE